MNAIEIITAVHAHQADLALENGRLFIRGRGERLPEDIREAIRELKTELVVALGQPMDGVVADILRDLRPQLPPSLQRLPDDRLLALVNWSIIAAWAGTMRKAAAS